MYRWISWERDRTKITMACNYCQTYLILLIKASGFEIFFSVFASIKIKFITLYYGYPLSFLFFFAAFSFIIYIFIIQLNIYFFIFHSFIIFSFYLSVCFFPVIHCLFVLVCAKSNTISDP